MNRPLLGLLAGAVIGFLDGGTAKFTSPEQQYQDVLLLIMFSSSIKGLIGGLITGLVARKTGSLLRGAVIGLGVAVLLAAIVAQMQVAEYDDPRLYWRIMLPGAVTGLLVGYTVVRYGRPAGGEPARA